MDQKNIIPCQRPRFAIAEVDSKGNESVGIYSLREYAKEFEDVSMDRRGFCKLSLFLQMAAVLAANFPVSSLADESGTKATLTEAPLFSVGGEIVKTNTADSETTIICVKIKLDNATNSNKEHGTTSIKNLKVGDIVNLTIYQPRGSLSTSNGERSRIDMLGQIISIDSNNNIVCIEVSGDTRVYGNKTEMRAGSKGNNRSTMLGYRVYLRHINISITDIRELHLKIGHVIHSGPIWIKGEKIYFSRGGGAVGVLTKNVNIPKSLVETLKKNLSGEAFVEIPIYGSGSGRSDRRSNRPSRSRNAHKCGRSTRRCACVPV